MKRTVINCLSYLILPAFVAGLLVIVQVMDPSPTVGYTQRLGAALALSGVGSLIPYFLTDDILDRRFGEVSTVGGYTVRFHPDEKDNFDFARVGLLALLVAGIIFWILNIILPARLSITQPTLANTFWLTGVVFFMLTGAVFVYINFRPSSGRTVIIAEPTVTTTPAALNGNP